MLFYLSVISVPCILCINSGKDHIAYRLYLESPYTNVAVFKISAER